MMHSTNEFDYINEICRIIIEDCGHSMVWVGYAQNDELKSVVPVAFHGLEDEYIDKLNISWADNERGRGPTGTAIRTGKVTMCKNMLTDPAFKPWRKAAIQNGYASSLVFPLISEGKAFGAISIYSKEPDPFLESEIKLLSDLVDDLAYGISFLRLEESERAATNAIKENEIKLKELIITKDKFFNIVAHDLKNPFTSLLGASELLYSNISEMTPENVRKLALILNDSAKGGYAILQNLLDWSRSQTGLIKFNPENINLKLLINENIENLQLQVANKEINMRSELTEDLFICADQNMINTVLRNLLSNAVKYTFKNGTILVKVSRTAEEVVVSVKDSGIGITRDVLDNLFRLENSLSLPGTEKEKGTGLGLKLCKEFTEMMGGKIWVESNLGQGSEFSFTIPFNSVKNQEINSQLIKTI
jgi:signal transduction histidine kinase